MFKEHRLCAPLGIRSKEYSPFIDSFSIDIILYAVAIYMRPES